MTATKADLAELRADLSGEMAGRIDAQTSMFQTMSGDISVDVKALREALARHETEERAMHEEWKGESERIARHVDGDSTRPGLVARMADAEAAQAADDDARKLVRWALAALKIVALPCVGLLGWLGAEAWGAHQAIASNGHEIAIVKTRLEHIEDLREQADDHHRELLEALEDR